METNLARTFAALSATNEAILYAKSPKELYEQVSKAAFSSGDFLATAVFLLEPGSHLLRFVAGFGEDIARLRSITISILAGTPEGSGVCGEAFRDQRPCVSNDFLNDARSLAWRPGAQKGQLGAAAAMPLICNGESIGVLLITKREQGSISEPTVSLLQRMSANISFALDNFDHEAARKNGERAVRRLNRMFGAISATNEAILRAKTEQDLYQRICDAAVHSGKSVATVVLLAEPGSIWLKPVAGTGESIEQITQSRFSIDPDNAYGNGVCGRAFRTQKPCINSDIQNSDQGRPWREAGHETGVMACVAVPLIKAGQSVGVLMFFVGRSWAADEEIVALLARMAENVSFALDNFHRAQEKAKADQQRERLTRMFAALSATNEAIMRAKSRAELFDLVCEAAVRGAKFVSTSVALTEPELAAPSCCRLDRTGRARDETVAVGDYRTAPPWTRADRVGVPYPAALRQQRLSGRRTDQAVVRQRDPKWSRDRLRFCRCSMAIGRRECSFFIRPSWGRLRPNSSNCCSGWRKTSHSPWRISIAPTKKPRPRNKRIACPGC